MADDHSGPGASLGAGLREHQMVRLLSEQISGEGRWPVGSVGAIVMVHERGRAFEVEFSRPSAGVLTVDAHALAPA
ncbi:hypothetical protein BH09PSE2_BH09PSE2_22880 [soil metagenome]